jgi:hypothetical protein
MNKVVIGATLKADGSQATETVRNFRKELKEAQQSLVGIQEAFGALSPAAIEAAKKVADLKDQIQEAREVSDLFDPGKKFQTLTNVASAIAGGFGAAQGAMALFGVESEDVEKALLKVQAAMALSQGLSTIADSKKDFERLGVIISQNTVFIKLNDITTKAATFTTKLFAGGMRLLGVSVETTGTAFKVLKGAIAATGIGVLLLLVGEAVSLFNELTTAAQRAAEAEKEALALRTKGADADLQGRLASIAREEQLSQARLKKQGATEKQLFEDQQSWQRIKIKSLEDHLLEVTGDEKKAQETRDKLKEERNKLELNQLNYEVSINQKARDEQKKDSDKAIAEAKRKADELAKQRQAEIDAAKKLNAELQNENEVSQAGGGRSSEMVKLLQEYEEKADVLKVGNQSLLELDLWFNEQKKAIDKKYRDEELKEQIAAIDAQIQKEQEAAQAKIDARDKSYNAIKEAAAGLVLDETLSYELRRQILDEGEQGMLASSQFTEEQKTAMKKAFSDARVEIDRKEMDAKREMLDLEAGLMNAASELAGRQTAVGKTLAVASTTISTYTAAQRAYESQFLPVPDPTSPVRGAVAAATAVLSGLAKVKAILSVKVPGGGGVSTPSLSAGNTTAPLSPQLPQTTTTALDQNTINRIGNQAIRAFVLETDVTSQQSKIREINRRARIG